MGVDGACMGEMRVWRKCGGGKRIGAWERGAKIGGVEVGDEGRGSGEEARDSVRGADSEDGRGEEEGNGWVGVNGMRSVEWGGLSKQSFRLEMRLDAVDGCDDISDTAESARCFCFAPSPFHAVTVRFIRLLSQAKSNLVIAWMDGVVKRIIREHGDDVVKASLSHRQTQFSSCLASRICSPWYRAGVIGAGKLCVLIIPWGLYAPYLPLLVSHTRVREDVVYIKSID